MRVTVSADGGRRRRMRANALVVGNVGWLRGGLRVALHREQPGELDADVAELACQLTVVAQPGGLLPRMPPESA